MHSREFAKSPRRTILDARLTAVTPSGQYDRVKLINLGTNRWGFKPMGVSVPWGRWDANAYFEVWLFSPNDDFYPGELRRTRPGTR